MLHYRYAGEAAGTEIKDAAEAVIQNCASWDSLKQLDFVEFDHPWIYKCTLAHIVLERRSQDLALVTEIREDKNRCHYFMLQWAYSKETNESLEARGRRLRNRNQHRTVSSSTI
jgi:hypothetical protein